MRKATSIDPDSTMTNRLHSTLVSPSGLNQAVELKPRKENSLTQSLDIAAIRQKISRDIRSRQHDRKLLNGDDRKADDPNSGSKLGYTTGQSDQDDILTKDDYKLKI